MLEAEKRAGAVFKGVVGKLCGQRREENLDQGRALSATFEADVDELGIFNTRVNWGDVGLHSVPVGNGVDAPSDGAPSFEADSQDMGLQSLFLPDVCAPSQANVRPDPGDPTLHRTASNSNPEIGLPTGYILTHLPKRDLSPQHISLQVPACSPFERRETISSPFSNDMPVWALITLTMAVNTCIVVLLGYLSEWFNPGESTISQQAWVVTWLVAGLGGGLLSAILMTDLSGRFIPFPDEDLELDIGVTAQIRLGVAILALCTPAIGLFVVVGQMIGQYGSCTKV
ncbi:hypothetical protein B0H19DRAFT_1123020 [Mycena capillaripes]|nr:hypothetical protein B0H19DRAFT_1123020 [Mycena capillaripes]